MDSAEWRICQDARTMMGVVRETTSLRKLRLFACACCRCIWHLLTDERNRYAIEVAERFAESHCDESQLNEAREKSYSVYANTSRPDWGFSDAAIGLSPSSWEAAQAATVAAVPATALSEAYYNAMVVLEQTEMAAVCAALEDQMPGLIANYAKRAAELAIQATHADLVRELFGNPFASVAIERNWLQWREGRIPKMAQSIIEERRFDTLPILGDALEEAGCESQEVLSHCRDSKPHAYGCWLIDSILGKS